MKTKVVKGIHLPESDTHFAKHLERGPLFEGRGTYQYSKIEKALALCRRYRPEMRHAVDIGAHVGLWSRVLASHFERVTAFEAHPDLAEIFPMNVTAGNVTFHAEALADSARPLHVEYTPDNSGNAHIAKGGQKVNATTLDSYMLDEVDFIKIDVEGFEKFVLLGGEETIRDCQPVMVVEQKPGHGKRYGLGDTDAIDLLHSWGAKTAAVKAGDYFMVWG